MAADTASIDAVGFLQVRRDPRLLRLVSVGQTQLGAERFGLLVDLPTHHVCLRCIPQTGRAAGERAFQVLLMKNRMARFAQRHQVVRAITTRFPRLNMVDGENRIVGLPLTQLATMLVAPEHILTGIPKIVLRPCSYSSPAITGLLSFCKSNCAISMVVRLTGKIACTNRMALRWLATWCLTEGASHPLGFFLFAYRASL